MNAVTSITLAVEALLCFSQRRDAFRNAHITIICRGYPPGVWSPIGAYQELTASLERMPESPSSNSP